MYPPCLGQPTAIVRALLLFGLTLLPIHRSLRLVKSGARCRAAIYQRMRVMPYTESAVVPMQDVMLSLDYKDLCFAEETIEKKVRQLDEFFALTGSMAIAWRCVCVRVCVRACVCVPAVYTALAFLPILTIFRCTWSLMFSPELCCALQVCSLESGKTTMDGFLKNMALLPRSGALATS